jgi:hypothetical protein
MQETLYKIKNPGEVPAEQAEYYELFIDQKHDATGKAWYFVRELHGWWSEEQKRAINNLETLSPEEGFPNFEGARERYIEQRAFRAKGGFVHSFSVNFFGKPDGDYRLIK